MGRTPAQRRRSEALLRRPRRAAVLFGLWFAIWMTGCYLLFSDASLVAALIVGAINGAVSGPLMINIMRRRADRAQH
jgi:hypothetical protein